MSTIEPMTLYGRLRMGSTDALPRVVPISRARIPRVVRRRACKTALLAKRDVAQEPYFQTDKRLTTKYS